MTADSSLLQSEIRKLYRDGKKFQSKLPPVPQGELDTDVFRPIARRYGLSVADVRTAVKFTESVDHIAAAVGVWARKLILSGQHCLLTPVRVSKLAGRSPRFLERAMRRVAAGFHPQARPAVSGSPAENAIWEYYLERLQRAARLLHPNETRLPALAISDAEKVRIYKHATAIRAVSAALLLSLNGSSRGNYPSPSPVAQAPILFNYVRRARGVVDALGRDLPLFLSGVQSPAPSAIKMLTSSTNLVHDLGARIAAFNKGPAAPRVNLAAGKILDRPEVPDKSLGTYIIILRWERANVLHIGRLGTFWLPAGYWLYVGNACGAGGVKKRTSRHQTADSSRMWNLDHIKMIASPVELWWTEHPKEVELECPWAMSLAELPGYSCPAPRFGGNDCKKKKEECPAHLYHTRRRPSCDSFAEVVRQKIPNHGIIFRQRLDR